MSDGDEPRFAPRLNHVAITVDPTVMDAAGRAEILAFHRQVFGWTEGDNTGESGDPLILYTGAFGQFVYLLPSDPPLVAPPLDHFGLEVATRAELAAIVARATVYRARDPRVRIVDVATRRARGTDADYTLTNAYVGFLLPLLIELQHLERHERV